MLISLNMNGEYDCDDENIPIEKPVFVIVWCKVKQAFVRDPDGYYLEFCRSIPKLTQNQIFSPTIFLLKQSEFCPSLKSLISVARCLKTTWYKPRVRRKKLHKQNIEDGFNIYNQYFHK